MGMEWLMMKGLYHNSAIKSILKLNKAKKKPEPTPVNGKYKHNYIISFVPIHNLYYQIKLGQIRKRAGVKREKQTETRKKRKRRVSEKFQLI